MKTKTICAVIVLTAGCAAGVSGVFGQLPARKGPATAIHDVSGMKNTPVGDAPSGSPAGTDIATKLAEARTALAATEALVSVSASNLPSGVSHQDVATRRALLHRLVRLYEQHLRSVEELKVAKSRRAALSREAQDWVRFAEAPPYSILLTDRLREAIQSEQLSIISGEAAVTSIDLLSAENKLTLADAEEKIRQFNEQLEGAKDPAAAASISRQRELERLRSQVAAATVGELDLERQVRREILAENRIRLDWFQRQLIIADASATFTQADLDKVTGQIDRERQQLETELADAHSRRDTILRALETSRTVSNPDKTPVMANLEAQLLTTDGMIRTLNLILETTNVERTMWEMRFTAFGSRTAEDLRQSGSRLKNLTRRLDLWRDYQQQQLVVSPSQIELLETWIGNLPSDSPMLPLHRERLAALREADQLLLRLVRRIDRVERLGQRWAEGLRAAEGRLPFLDRAKNLFSGAGSFVERVWTFELFTAEDTITVEGQEITGKRSITLGKIIKALLIVGVGYWITGLLVRLIEPILIRRLKIEANQAKLIYRWVRAFLIACLVVFSLVSVKIPLTVFAFAGGALAIGLGFGMQTMLKNLVSGLILLIERPFRVGDVLDIGGQRGPVTQIGLRASVLQLWDGTETLIPNSFLLENNVSNWTYSNQKVRFSITVGVVYGADIRRVIQLLGEVAERHGVVETFPAPQVLFTDFGESALNFELRFWVNVIKANAAQVGSELRQMIATAFAENGIAVAFPQRDLHLNATRPLPVVLVPAADVPQPPCHSQGATPENQSSQDTKRLP
jgi:small-conductance mechanosensitive channel